MIPKNCEENLSEDNVSSLGLTVMTFKPIFFLLYCNTSPSLGKHLSRCAASLHTKRLLVFLKLSKGPNNLVDGSQYQKYTG